MVGTEFFQRSVYETMNLRRKSWKVAFELMLLLFRKVEDSGGMVELCSACDEVHLNCLMEQAEQRADKCFRSPGGNPGASLADSSKDDNDKVKAKPFNGRSTPGTRACAHFNNGSTHAAQCLTEDGTCKFSHVCNKWVSDKGANGRCGGKHARKYCDNPAKCDERVQA
jgi:hypothetical protein